MFKHGNIHELKLTDSGIDTTTARVVCPCGFRAFQLMVTGLTGLKKSILCRKLIKSARHDGFKIVTKIPERCPNCKEMFGATEHYIEDSETASGWRLVDKE